MNFSATQPPFSRFMYRGKMIALAGIALVLVACGGEREVTITNPETGAVQSSGMTDAKGNQGIWRHYHDNGSLAATGPWLADMQHGSWEGYHSDGNIHFRGAYDNGFRQGEWTYFFSNGNPQLRGSYNRDRQVGTWQRWQVDGTPLPDLFFEANGRLDIARTAAADQAIATTSHEAKVLPETLPAELGALPAVLVDPEENAKISPSLTFPELFTSMEFAMKKVAALELYDTGQVEEDGVYGKRSEILAFETNRPDLIGQSLPAQRLLGVNGRVIDLNDYKGQRVVVVMLRGFAGQICLYCSTQTRVLTERLAEFAERQSEVVIVYPGSTSSVRDFLKGVKAVGGNVDALPGIGLDVNTQWVSALRTDGDISKPSTFIIDQNGKIAYAYMGEDKVDRPSVDYLLKVLDNLQ